MTDKNETVANDSGNAKSKRRYDEENDILDESSSKHTKTIPDKKEDEKKIVGYEYLDHTADIQFHTWAPTLKESFEQVLLCMFNYMTDINTVDISDTREYQVEGHDLESLLYAFMDEFLFIFSTEFFVCKEVQITEFDVETFKIKAIGKGETFDRSKHPQGTEIKAITFSNMQITTTDNNSEVYVIVDI